MSIAFLSAAYSAMSSTSSSAPSPRAPYPESRVRSATDGGPTRCRIGRPAATRAGIMRGGDVEAGHVEEADAPGAGEAGAAARACPALADVPALGHGQPGDRSTVSRLAPLREGQAMSPPTMKVSSSPGPHRRAPAGYRRCTTARPVGLDARDLEAGARSPTASRAQLQPHLDARVAPAPPCAAASPPGTSRTTSSPSWSRASMAHTRCPRCGGLNVPPSSPTFGAYRHLAGALDQVPVGAQLAQADRAAGVQLLGRVGDLGAHAELAAVGEARRGVDVHAGGVDARAGTHGPRPQSRR